MWATAQARVTGYRLTDEWREAGLMKVSISATIAPIDAPSCGADPLPPVHLGEMRLDVDPALHPAAADPLVPQFRYALRRAFGADPRSEERPVGKECISTSRSRWSPST